MIIPPQLRVLILTFVMFLLPGATVGAAPGPGPLPAFKLPLPARITTLGHVAFADIVHTSIGTGAQVDDRFQMDSYDTLASSTTFHRIQIGSMYYLKDGDTSPHWQVIDLEKRPQDVLPFSPRGLALLYRAAIRSQALGREIIADKPTIKYVADIDYRQFATLIGTPAKEIAKISTGDTITLYLWIGENDQYLYQQRLDWPEGVGGGAFTLTLTYHDIGIPLTITAPTDLMPYIPPGMPGAGKEDHAITLVLLIAGAVCLMAGSQVRRGYTPDS
jgi:hypothetical protein